MDGQVGASSLQILLGEEENTQGKSDTVMAPGSARPQAHSPVHQLEVLLPQSAMLLPSSCTILLQL